MYYPITRASLNLTRACPLACSYCFTNGCRSGDLSEEMGKRAIDFLFEGASQCQGRDRNVEISWWGGEPLLKWSLLKKLTLYAEDVSRKSAIPVSFGGTTNGLLLTPDKFDFLDSHHTFFMVSFDGTKETHDYYRKSAQGVGSHKIVERNLKAALIRWPFYRTRMGPFVERIDHFFEDCKYTFDLGVTYLMFSPVYEGNWTEEKWKIFEDQCMKVVDYMAELRAQGRKVDIEHFRSYTGKDNSRWACGAGRQYVGVDIDGAIYPCHRYNKFSDNRPWQEKEVCIGHVEHGITRPEFRQIFIDGDHSLCGKCPRLEDTPCHGSCPAVNYDFTGNPMKPHLGACRYVEMQKRVSKYYKEKIMDKEEGVQTSCMPYNGPDRSCDCYNANYTGPIKPKKLTDEVIAMLLQDLNARVAKLEAKSNG